MHQHSGALEQKWNRPDPFFQWAQKCGLGTRLPFQIPGFCSFVVRTTSDHNEKTEAYSTRVAYYFFYLYMGLDARAKHQAS